MVRVGSLPGIAEFHGGAEAVFSSTTLVLLAAEVALIVLALALALYLPSRQRDFV